MTACVTDLVDVLSNFERILRTPIPLAYSIHLHQSVWLYILGLPFQVIGDSGWWTIPIVVLGGFCLIGILTIGQEIENPFGYDTNDLPLDDFCDVMRKEIEMICGNNLLPAEEWIFSDNNFPLGPAYPVNANQLAEKTPQEILRILANVASTEITVEQLTGGKKQPQTSSYGTTGYQRLG